MAALFNGSVTNIIIDERLYLSKEVKEIVKEGWCG